jgi:acetate kinase
MDAESNNREKLSESAFRKSDDPYGFKLKTDKPMKLLVINCGSSSLKYNLFDTEIDAKSVHGIIERIGEDRGMKLTHRSQGGVSERDLPPGSHREAFGAMMEELTSNGPGPSLSLSEIGAVGHRVVHGGDRFAGPELITNSVLQEIENLSALAPLHNPVNLAGIREAQRVLPSVPHIAVFDTSFHQTLPPYAYLYGLPYEYYEQKHIRRYGFHGMSHAYVSLKASEFLKRPFNKLEIVSCHLGNGASVCAIDHGRSIDTSMGFTPVDGLIMGTRCGDIDPAILIHLMRTEGIDVDDLDRLINKQSGLKGLSGVSNDMREIERAAQGGNHQALLATKTFCYQVRKYIGAYGAAIGGLDALIFTGGIGQGSAGVRSLACQRLDYMGISIDEDLNREASGFGQVIDISKKDAAVRVLVVPTDEERMIARETLRVIDRRYVNSIIRKQEHAPVPIEVSAHHVHLSREHVDSLFGTGHHLTAVNALSQPGQYSCKEQVDLIGTKGRVERVRVLGPVRRETQIEISMTEQFKLGLQPPIRESGDLKDSPGITIQGSKGSVKLPNGVICALRHIHMSPEDALTFGLRDKDRVRVRVQGGRDLTFGDVLIRIHPDFKIAMHIDTDEANAANIRTGMIGQIVEISS